MHGLLIPSLTYVLGLRVKGSKLASCVCLLTALVCVTLSHPVSAQEAITQKNVLVLYSSSDRTFTGEVNSLESELRTHSPWPVNFYVEYLEGKSFDDEAYENAVAEALQSRYSGQKLDLVMPESPAALDFILKYRDRLFPGVPIVFFEVDVTWPVVQKRWPGVTGVTVNTDARATIDLALHLQPDTKVVAVITNDSAWEKHWLTVIHAELVRHRDTIKEIDLVALPPDQLLQRVDSLSPHTLLLFQEIQDASSQPVIGSYDLLALVGQRRPTYCLWADICLNRGGIGGNRVDFENLAPLEAELARRVLSGERPDDIPVVNYRTQHPRVDWRQLQRWHIPESALPPGSVVLYREPTLWERDHKYFLTAIAVIVVQALLIFGLLWQRARKHRAEAVLRESEERFRVMADTTPSLIWMCDEEGKITYLNDQRVAFTGPGPDTGYGNDWTAYVHSDDLKNVQEALAWALESRQRFSKEYRLRRYDGVYRWMFDIASPRVNGDGSFAGLIGSAIDITDQKLAQEALQTVGGRLLQAQDEERKRIARELHDDISQKLALLSMELAQANCSANGSVEATRERLNDIRQHCSDIAKDIQSLSHQLHYSKLDYLGLVGALKGFCREFAKQYDVSVDFKEEGVPRKLPTQVSLCLFRVTQEALHNAAKYSGAREFAVRLNATADEVQLVVSDAGAGFDVAEAMKNQGLGLVSMQERVHLVQGRFNIESRPGEGTKIVVTVPVIVNGASTKSAANVPGAA